MWGNAGKEVAYPLLLGAYRFYKSLLLLNLNPLGDIVAAQERQLESFQ